jgi:hypothetical protein
MTRHAEERAIERSRIVGCGHMKALIRLAEGTTSMEEVDVAYRLPRPIRGKQYIVATVIENDIVTVKLMSSSAVRNARKYKRVLS